MYLYSFLIVTTSSILHLSATSSRVIPEPTNSCEGSGCRIESGLWNDIFKFRLFVVGYESCFDISVMQLF